MRLCAAAAVSLCVLLASLPAGADFSTVYDTAGRRLDDASLYRALMSQLADEKVLAPFPRDGAQMRASYDLLDRTVYYAFEAQTLLEIVSAKAGAADLDGASPEPGVRQKRLADMVGWGLWLMSREAVNCAGTMGGEGPWEARRFRGWGKKDFQNRSGGFPGWHTFAEQTSVPLIGLLQAAQAIRLFLATAPELAEQPVFDAVTGAGLRAAGVLQLLPPGLQSAPEIEACQSNPACRWDATTVTWAGAADTFEAFSGSVLLWWRARAMTELGGARYFWYTADGDAEFAGTGFAARQWFVIHANMLMGRAAYLYGRATGERSFVDLAAELMAEFASVHYLCETPRQAISCYHYAVKAHEWRAWRLTAERLSPDVVGMSPPRSLEEPFHRNASHALMGLLSGGSILSGPETGVPAAFLAGAQRTYLEAYAQRRGDSSCGFLLPAQCNLAPVEGPPTVRASGNAWTVAAEPRFVPEESLSLDGETFTLPDYRSAQPIAGFYLAEGASEALFERLVLWWDAFGRRNARNADGAVCTAAKGCPTPYASANFRKMAVFLAAEAYRRAQAAKPAAPAERDPQGGCTSGGGVPGWAVGFVLLLAVRKVRGVQRRTR